jgi:hypothetical protein
MKRVAPGERIEQEIDQLLREGLHTEEQPLSQLIRLSARKVVQEALEKEVEAFLGRERYERRSDEQQGLRNGYEPGRAAMSAVQSEREMVGGEILSPHPAIAMMVSFLPYSAAQTSIASFHPPGCRQQGSARKTCDPPRFVVKGRLPVPGLCIAQGTAWSKLGCCRSNKLLHPGAPRSRALYIGCQRH